VTPSGKMFKNNFCALFITTRYKLVLQKTNAFISKQKDLKIVVV
jgi:hypothetical protein